MQYITSKANRHYKQWQQIIKGKGEYTKTFVLEGLRLCHDAWQVIQKTSFEKSVRGNTDVGCEEMSVLHGICVSKSALKKEVISSFLTEVEEGLRTFNIDIEIYVFDDPLFAPLAETQTSQGILMAIDMCLPLDLSEASRVLVLDCLQDPGNLGSVWRSADAFGFDAIILTKGSVQPQNRKVLRAAMGSVFHVPVTTYLSWEDVFANLKESGFKLLATSLQGEILDETKMTAFGAERKLALIIGNEGRGLPAEACAAADEAVKIPMVGRAESLNAACAASILCFSLRKT